MKLNNYTQKLTFSGMLMAIYVVVVYLTQSFSFGAYQIRIATALYALAYPFPFLTVPLALANMLSNFLASTFGLADIIGGFLVGLGTTGTIVLLRKWHCSVWFVALPILLVPGLGVPIYLSYLLNMPYWLLALNLCVGQAIPSVCGVLLIKLFQRIMAPERRKEDVQ